MWFRVSDDFPDHPKVRRAAQILGGDKRRARGRVCATWLEAGTRCAKYLTNGFISLLDAGDLLADPAPLAVLDACVGAQVRPDGKGLFLRENDGYRFWQWHEHQLAAEPAKERRAFDALWRQLKGNRLLLDALRARAKGCCEYCRRAINFQDRRGDHGGTYFILDLARPLTLGNVIVCCRDCRDRRTAPADLSREAIGQGDVHAQIPSGHLDFESDQDPVINQVRNQVRFSLKTRTELEINLVQTRSDQIPPAHAYTRDPVPSRPDPVGTDQKPRAVRAQLSLLPMGVVRPHLRAAAHGVLEQTPEIAESDLADDLKRVAASLRADYNGREIQKVIDAVRGLRARRAS